MRNLGPTLQAPLRAAHHQGNARLAASPGSPLLAAHADKASEDDIRWRAFRIWEENGFPVGGHELYLVQAELELRGRS